MSTPKSTTTTTRRSLAGVSVLILGLAVSARLIFGGPIFSGSDHSENQTIAEETNVVSLEPRTSMRPAATTKPIDSVKVGDRVLANNPEINDRERASWKEPAWDRWLRLSMKMPMPASGPEASGHEASGHEASGANSEMEMLHVEILRPESWFVDRVGFVVRSIDGAPSPVHPTSIFDFALPSANGSAKYAPLCEAFRHVRLTEDQLESRGLELVGLSIELNLPEMGAVGTAYVSAIHPHTSVQDGDGQVVTATFSHPPATAVLDVTFQGESAPIGVTDNHPFWSEDRERFIPIGEMELGERVVTFHGETKRIESKLPRPGPQLVYNLEVYGEHVYFVGEQGLLVHNSYQTKADRLRNKSQVDLLRDEAFAVLKSTRRHVEKVMKRDPKLKTLRDSAKGGDSQASMIYGFILDARVKRALQQPGAATGITRIKGLVFSSGGSRTGSVVKPGGNFGVKGEYRLPDFTFTQGGAREFWDLKAPGFNRATSRQFDDIRNWTGVEPIALRYNR